MKHYTLVLAVLASIPVMGLAEGPATRPSSEFATPPATGAPAPGFKPDRAMRPLPGGGPWMRRDREGPPPSPAELEAAEQFLKENLPNRYQLFSQLKPGSP